MSVERVWIYYQPKILSDIFKRIICAFGTIEILDGSPLESLPGHTSDGCLNELDLVVTSIDGWQELELKPNSDCLLNAWMIAFSPLGDYGLRRPPRSGKWEEIRPFRLSRFLQEVHTLSEKAS